MAGWYSRRGSFQTAIVVQIEWLPDSEAMPEKEMIIAYWLLPAEPARSRLVQIVRDLAERFSAPIFEPHVTVYATGANQVNPAAVLGGVLPEQRPFRLLVRDVDFSDKFTKTLFVQFAPDPGLTRFSEELRRASATASDYRLNPHLSLIYQTMTRETQRDLAKTISLPFSEVEFDAVKAIVSPAEITTRDEVAAWRGVAERKLRE
jgi:2'-5' RNA ligase